MIVIDLLTLTLKLWFDLVNADRKISRSTRALWVMRHTYVHICKYIQYVAFVALTPRRNPVFGPKASEKAGVRLEARPVLLFEG